MPNNIVLTAFISLLSTLGFSQFNDTIIYRSGMEKIVEIEDFSETQLTYLYINRNKDTVKSTLKIKTVNRFVIYDEDGVLQYDSEFISGRKESKKYPTSVTVSKHEISINPFLLPFLSLSGKYMYNFGDKMQFSSLSRLTYISPTLLGDLANNFFTVGTGVKFTPYYNDHFAFGVDFVPLFILADDEIGLALPISLDFDRKFNERWGVSFDVGMGTIIVNGGDNLFFRGNVGVLWSLKTKKTFETGY